MVQIKKNFSFIFFVVLVSDSESLIKWNVMKKSIKIGDQAILNCTVNTCPHNTRKTWYGGESYDLLSYDKISTNPQKYAMESSDTSFDTSLIIKHFNFTDVNYEYTCACGFNRDTHMLKLDDLEFVYGDFKDSSKLKDDRFLVEVEMKVYPIPTCSITYMFKEYKTSVVIAESVKSNGHITEPYIVTIHANIVPSDSMCFIKITCKGGSSKYSYNILDINICKDGGNARSVSAALSRLKSSVGVILISIIVSFL